MEALTRLVSESFARHGFDRPIDYRRLKWSRWFRCESHHSLLFVPSKPGIFAMAEEISSDVGTDNNPALNRVDASVSRAPSHIFVPEVESRKPELPRMLAVTQFFEADDMAFVLDRMLSRYNPMRGRLESGRYFIRFVIVEDQSQRRNIHLALNRWLRASVERNTDTDARKDLSDSAGPDPGVQPLVPFDDSQGSLFSSAEMGRIVFSAHLAAQNRVEAEAFVRPAEPSSVPAPEHSSEAGENEADPKIYPCPFPSGF